MKAGRAALITSLSGKYCMWIALLSVLHGYFLYPAIADPFGCQGTFKQDNTIRLFWITLTTFDETALLSYAYAGGTTAEGLSVYPGGFDTVLTLFDETGALVTENDDGLDAAADPITGQAFDAQIKGFFATGAYIVALSQFGNRAAGNTLFDGFINSDHPFFTNDSTFASGIPCEGGFKDITGNCRSNQYSIDFINAENSFVSISTPPRRDPAASPEPATCWLVIVSLLLGFWLICGRECVEQRA